MDGKTCGRVIAGNEEDVRRSYARFHAQPVDLEMRDGGGYAPIESQTTVGQTVSVTGPGTFFGKAQRTLTFEPSVTKGWWFQRADLPDAMPIGVSVHNIWTTVRNIVLCSGSPHNYMRMVEHIVALKVGLSLDNVVIRMDSGDPPLFDRGSLDLVEAVERAGIVKQKDPPVYVTVREPVTVGGRNGSFLTFLPPEGKARTLSVDCAVDFRSAIGRQRIRFAVNPRTFRHGALARTNCTLWQMLYTRTIGKIFADVRNLGYTPENILIAGRYRYLNKPGLMHNGKSLEAAWHRATLDLLAAAALVERGRFVGRIESYKSGHALDVQTIRELHQRDLLVEA